MKQLMDTNDYENYLKKQWKEVDRMYELKLFSKHIDLLEEFVKIMKPNSFKEAKILCVGARYGIELMAFEQIGFLRNNITAIDLYPRNAEIVKADMHFLPFDDKCFDIIYSHHSLDHSIDPLKALTEMDRISKENSYWIFTIPFDDYSKEESIDFDSADEVLNLVMRFKKRILFRKQVSRNKEGFVEPKDTWLPVGWKNEIRLIVQ